MKRIFLFLSFLSMFLCVRAQLNITPSCSTDSIAIYTTDMVNDLVTMQMRRDLSERYKIYSTENNYILIKLDTQTGKIQLIQWSLKSEDEFTVSLNKNDLSKYAGVNSFELYPTKNIYQFILLDKATGRTWHVQWGTGSSDRWIKSIDNPYYDN